jgi:hypothetical protein
MLELELELELELGLELPIVIPNLYSSMLSTSGVVCDLAGMVQRGVGTDHGVRQSY